MRRTHPLAVSPAVGAWRAYWTCKVFQSLTGSRVRNTRLTRRRFGHQWTPKPWWTPRGHRTDTKPTPRDPAFLAQPLLAPFGQDFLIKMQNVLFARRLLEEVAATSLGVHVRRLEPLDKLLHLDQTVRDHLLHRHVVQRGEHVVALQFGLLPGDLVRSGARAEARRRRPFGWRLFCGYRTAPPIPSSDGST